MASTAVPEEREKQHLPLKIYADDIEDQNGAVNGNGAGENKGKENELINGGTTNGQGGDGIVHAEKVLKIVDTGAEPREKKTNTQKERPNFLRQESKPEYQAQGIDETPKSPPRQKARKPASNKFTRSMNGIDPNLSTAEKIVGGKNGDSRSTKEYTGADKKMVEKVEHNGNCHKIISLRPSENYQTQLAQDRKERPLSSGKQAGQRWKNSAIRWAPLSIPLQRRLQTCVVLFHTLCIAMGVSIFFFLCAIPLFWPLLMPYMIYCMWSTASTSGMLSYRSDFLRGLPVWSLFASYFPARLHRTEELPPTRKYIFGYHPHGIISHGAFAAFGTEALGFSQLFPGIKNTLLTLDTNFRIPIYREYALAMGLASVSKESCENILSKGGPNKEGMGRAITIVVGGAAESLDAQPYSLRLVLAKRKGFVKMAIRTGADLVPVLCFGENDIYDQFSVDTHPTIHRFQLLVKKLMGFTIPLFHARGVFNYDVGLMPYRRPLNIVVGPAVRVVQEQEPGQEVIDRVHAEYVKQLERLWELWKDDFSPNRKEEMQILE